MSGWKSKAAGIGAILGGLALVIKGVVADSLDFQSIKEGIAAVIAGLGVLGVAHKIEKAGLPQA